MYKNTKKSVEEDFRRCLALNQSGVDPEIAANVLEALAGGDTAMQDVEMNDKDPLETMHATAQSSKDGGRMDEGSQMPEDSQDLHGDSQLDLQLIPEGGKEDEHGKGQPMLESSSDEDEYECEDADEAEAYDYDGAYGHEKEGDAWVEPAKKKQKIETQLDVLKAK